MRALKDGKLYGDPPTPVVAWVARYIKQNRNSLSPVLRFFGPTSVLVPVPGASLHQEGALWVPDQLSKELAAAGLGARAAPLLRRTEAIPKAATSIPAERPDAFKHFQTISVQTDLLPVPEVVLIDDIVTRGETMLGSANRLLTSYPGIPIRAFAAIRTVSNPEEFGRIVSPMTGVIQRQANGRCLRRP